MSRKEPESCNSMAELRHEIDRLDRDLVALLAQRAGYIDRAITLKRAADLPARITDRVNEVIANVRSLAQQHDLDPGLAELLWRELIEWSIRREHAALSSAPGSSDDAAR